MSATFYFFHLENHLRLPPLTVSKIDFSQMKTKRDCPLPLSRNRSKVEALI